MNRRTYLILGFVMLGLAIVTAFPRVERTMEPREHFTATGEWMREREPTWVAVWRMKPKTVGDGLIVLGFCLVGCTAFYLATRR